MISERLGPHDFGPVMRREDRPPAGLEAKDFERARVGIDEPRSG